MPAPENNQNAVKEDGDKATCFLYVRATALNKSLWLKASNRSKKKLSRWVTETLNEAAAEGGSERTHGAKAGAAKLADFLKQG